MNSKNNSPLGLGGIKGSSEKPHNRHFTENQADLKDLCKSLIGVGHQMFENCYQEHDSRIIIKQFLLGIRRIRGASYGK